MNWDSIPLRDVLQISRGYIPVLDQALYRYATLRPYPDGLRLEGQKRGADFHSKQHQMIRAGQFVISRTRVQQRHWGIVQSELNETIIHRNTLCFDIRPELNTNYFAAYLATLLFRKAALAARTKQGRLDVRRFARIVIPFPPLENQIRIAETWQYAYKVLQHTLDMYRSIADIKVGVAADLFKNASLSWEPKSLGECTVIGRDPSVQYSLYLTTSGKLLRTQSPLENDVIGIMPSRDLDHHFLQYYVECLKLGWYSAAGNTLVSLETALRALQIPMPTLYEQRKLVSVLQQHDDVLQKLKTEHTELRYLIQGMMQQIFSGILPLQEAISLFHTH